MGELEETVNGLVQELRRGTIVLAVLSQLNQPQYGYSMVSALEEKGFTVDANTLYPLLRRLEKQGLLESVWDTDESRPRKYYQLSVEGKRALRQLRGEWTKMVDGLNILLEGASNNGTH